jgi:hypothetical protein
VSKISGLCSGGVVLVRSYVATSVWRRLGRRVLLVMQFDSRDISREDQRSHSAYCIQESREKEKKRRVTYRTTKGNQKRYRDL